MLSTPSPSFADGADKGQEYDLYLLSTHFLGDGMALHTTANEFFALLQSGVDAAHASRAEEGEGAERAMAEAMETQLRTPSSWGRLAWAGARVDFERTQARLVVGSPLFSHLFFLFKFKRT